MENCFISSERFNDLNNTLKVVTTVLTQLNIPYWLESRTLQGSVLFGNVEPWARYVEITCITLKNIKRLQKSFKDHNLMVVNTHYNDDTLRGIFGNFTEPIDSMFIKFDKSRKLNKLKTFSVSKFKKPKNKRYVGNKQNLRLNENQFNNDHFNNDYLNEMNNNDYFNYLNENNDNHFNDNYETNERHFDKNVFDKTDFELKLSFIDLKQLGALKEYIFPLRSLVLGKVHYHVPKNYIYYIKNIQKFHEVNLKKLSLNSIENVPDCNETIPNLHNDSIMLKIIGTFYKNIHNEYFKSFFTNMFYTQSLPFNLENFKKVIGSLNKVFKNKRIKTENKYIRNIHKHDIYKNIFPIVKKPQKAQYITVDSINDTYLWIRYHEYYFLMYLSGSKNRTSLNTEPKFVNFLIFKRNISNKSSVNNGSNKSLKGSKSLPKVLKIPDFQIIGQKAVYLNNYENSWIELDLSKSTYTARTLIKKDPSKALKDTWILFKNKQLFLLQFKKIADFFKKAENVENVEKAESYFEKNEQNNKSLIVLNNSMKYFNMIRIKWFKKLQKHYKNLMNVPNGRKGTNEPVEISMKSPIVDYNDIEYIGIGQLNIYVENGFDENFVESLQDLILYNEKMKNPVKTFKCMFFYTVNKYTSELYRISNAFITKSRENIPIGIVKDHSKCLNANDSKHLNAKGSKKIMLKRKISSEYFTFLFKVPNNNNIKMKTLSKGVIDSLLSHHNTKNFNPKLYKFFKLV